MDYPKPPRVLMINHSYILWMNRLSLEKLAETGLVEVFVLAPENLPGKKLVIEPDIRQVHYHLLTSKIRLNGLRSPCFEKLAWFVKHIKPDIIFIGYEPGSITALQAVILGRIYKSKVVCFTVDNLYKTLKGEALRRLRNQNYKGAFGMFAAAAVERLILPRIWYLFSCNKEAEYSYRSYRRYHGKSSVIPIGINTSMFKKMDVTEKRSELGLNGFVIGYFGRLSPEKGVHLLYEAVSRLDKPCTLLVDRFLDDLGNSEYFVRLQTLAEQYHITEKIVYFNAAHHEMPLYMNCADCCVIPSITSSRLKEQYGRVVAEAMACGVPVIGSDSGNIPDLIGDAGLVFPEGNIESLYHALVKLMNTPDLLYELSERGRNRIEKYFSVEVEAGIFQRVFTEL